MHRWFRAEPGDGSVLTQAPKTVQLRFNEAGDAGRSSSLIDADGQSA